jgi:Family of unknown function (DUF5994)
VTRASTGRPGYRPQSARRDDSERLADATLPAVPIGSGHHHLRSVPDRDLHQLQRPLDSRRPRAAGDQPDPRTLPHGRRSPLTKQPPRPANAGNERCCEERETELDDMTPAGRHTATAALPTGPTASSGLRLRLDPGLSRVGIADGSWWPHSWDPDTELPELIAGLESSLGPITRVALNLDAWDRAPRRVAIDGRRARGLVPHDGRPHGRGDQSLPGSAGAAGGSTGGGRAGGAARDGDGRGCDQWRRASRHPYGRRDCLRRGRTP